MVGILLLSALGPDGGRRRDERRREDRGVALVRGQLVELRHRLRDVGLVVLDGHLEVAPEDAAGVVDGVDRLLDGCLVADAERRVGAGERDDHADLDRARAVGPSFGGAAAAARLSAPATVRAVSRVLIMVTSGSGAESGDYQGSCLSGFLIVEYDPRHTGCQQSVSECSRPLC